MNRFVENYKGEEFDIIVIGGGITGAAVAYDAAARGLSVALVEKQDFGGATSSATSKMAHGGARYLANLEFGLVRESLRERRTLEKIAPNFIYPLPTMIITGAKKLTNRKSVIKIGMIIYDILSFDKKWIKDRSKRLPGHKTLSLKRARGLEPNLQIKGATGAIVYYDCLSLFPERLTLAFIKSAVKYGAKAANYCKVENFIKHDNRVKGVVAQDIINKKNIKIIGKLVINCCGPWADIVLGIANGKKNDKVIRRSEGIHIIIKKLANTHCVACFTSKGRHVFFSPWREHTLIGTTDKEYIGDPDEYKATKESVKELMDDVNSLFKDGETARLNYSDILHVYGGLRPLVEDQTEDVYESSRKYEIYDNAEEGPEGLITVEGGKYTTSRNLAEHVMKLVFKKLALKPVKCVTNKNYLKGSEIEHMEKFIERIVNENQDFNKKTVELLGRNYGLEYKEVLDIARKDKSLSKVINGDGEILAQVVYAIQNEMALTMNDIILNRTGIGTLGNPGKKTLELVARTAAKYLLWDAQKIELEISISENKLKIPN